MRAFCVAALLVTVLGSGADAAPAGCAVISDPAGDVTANIAPVGGTPVSDGHLDIRAVTIRRSGNDLLVVIRNEKMSADRRGEWRLIFTASGRKLFVAAGAHVWANLGTTTDAGSGFRAGVVDGRSTRATGTIDYARNEIRVVAPRTAFGSAAPTDRTVISGISIEAKETLLNVAPNAIPVTDVSLRDSAAGRSAVVFGRC